MERTHSKPLLKYEAPRLRPAAWSPLSSSEKVLWGLFSNASFQGLDPSMKPLRLPARCRLFLEGRPRGGEAGSQLAEGAGANRAACGQQEEGAGAEQPQGQPAAVTRAGPSASASPPLSVRPRAGPTPPALTQQREGESFVPPRTPFVSLCIPPPRTPFPSSGPGGAQGRSRRGVGEPVCNLDVCLRTLKATVPPLGSVGAMNNTGEALLVPAGALPACSLGAQLGPWGPAAGMAGTELSEQAGAAGRQTASWGRTPGKGFSAAMVSSGCS